MPSEPIRLAVDARYATDAFPGIGRVTSGLARALAVHPGITALHLIVNPASTTTWATLPEASAHVHYHQIHAVPRTPAEQRNVLAFVNTLPIDWFFSPYLRLPRGHIRAQSIVMVHDAIPLSAPGIAMHVRMGYAAALWDVAWRASRVVTVSHAAAHALQPWLWWRQQPVVIPNGITQHWPDASAVDRARFGIHGSYALCVSSNQPHKHLTALVAAWRHLSARDRLPAGATLVLCGHMDARRAHPSHHDTTAAHPIVVLQDATDSVLHALYTHAQLAIQPSLAEGFGLPVLEALAHGVPVLAHDLPVYHEYAPGLVDTVDTRNPALFAAAIEALWHNHTRHAHIATAGPACAAQHTWEAAADALVVTMQKTPASQ